MNTIPTLTFTVYLKETAYIVYNVQLSSIPFVQMVKKSLKKEEAFTEIINLGLNDIHLFRRGNDSPNQELTNETVVDASWNGGQFVLKLSSSNQAPDIASYFSTLAVQDYTPSQLDQVNFSFLANIPEQLVVGVMLAKTSHLQYDRFTAIPWIKLEKESTCEIATALCEFLKNERTGTTEDGLHQRDDFLMKIIREIAVLKPERNTTSDSTLAQTRPDGYLYSEGFPPVVVWEEKSKDSELDEARADIRNKFRWLQHYGKLNFIVVISIAGDSVEFSKMTSVGLSSQTSFNLNNIAHRFSCVQAAINVGRWVKWVKTNDLLGRLDIPMNKVQKDAQGRRKLLISFQAVEKTFLQLSDSEKKTLTDFYADCNNVPYVEKLIAKEIPAKHPTWLKFTLSPVGITRMPQTENELGHAMSCICTALVGIHKKKWAHNDIRWPNIIYSEGNWILIDCEFVSRHGTPLPPLKITDPTCSRSCNASDLYLVGKLLEYYTFSAFGGSFDSLYKMLVVGEERLKLTVLSLKKNPWLARYWK